MSGWSRIEKITGWRENCLEGEWEPGDQLGGCWRSQGEGGLDAFTQVKQVEVVRSDHVHCSFQSRADKFAHMYMRKIES